MTELQKFTKERNFLKMRVMGFVLGDERVMKNHKKHFTVVEQNILKDIEKLRETLIKNWDDNTKTVIHNFKK